MNYIVSCLFTTCIDPLRGIKWNFDSRIMDNWYNSGVEICKSHNDIKLIVFHDGLDNNFLSKYDLEYITFVQVPNCGEYSPHDYRWFIYENFAQNNEFDKVFFTDISDIVIKSNPFQSLDPNTLYMGNEQHHTWNNSWALPRNEYYKSKLEDFTQVFESNNSGPFLNAGILGGHRDIVIKFLQHIIDYLSITLDKPYHTTDMIIFNYVIHKHFNTIKHGEPVNSIFHKNEIHRNDVWFVHK